MAYQTTTRRTTRRRIGASARQASRPASRSAGPRSSTRTASSRSRAARPRSASAQAAASAPTGPRAGRRSASLASNDQVDVQRLLDRFSDAFTQGDGRAAAKCFAYPNLLVMGNGTQLLEDEDTVAAFFDRAPAQYRPKGIHDTRADIHRIDRLNNRLLLVHAHWPYIDAEGKEMGDGESSVYLVRREPPGKALIAVAVPLGTDSERGIDRSVAERRRSARAAQPRKASRRRRSAPRTR